MSKKRVICLVGAIILITIVLSVSAQAQPRVNVMPGNRPGQVYEYTWPGRDLIIWGNVHGGTPPYTFEWTFGDGSPAVSGAVANPKYINVNHVYTTMGPKKAVLVVTDATMASDRDTVEIEVASMVFEVQVNAAIEDGLRYQYLQQQADGRWQDNYGYPITNTALAVLTFENQGHLPINDINKDIYAEYVKAGLDYLTSTLQTEPMTIQGAGDPEAPAPGNEDANGIGVYAGYSPPYEIGMVMMAMIGAGPLDSLGSAGPNLVAPNGPPGVIGRTYLDLVVDMVDYCAWAQNEPGTSGRGGWRYYANYGDADNSVSQWPAIGLEAAESNWFISAPAFVKSELELWINATQINGGGYDGGFYYSTGNWYTSLAPTGGGICEMAYCDIPQTDSRFQRALSFLEREWELQYHRGFYYTMYGIAKGCRIAVDDSAMLKEILWIGAIDWYTDYAGYLLGIQSPDGSWPNNNFGYLMDHSWAILVLQKTIVGAHPVAVIKGPASVPPNFLFDLDGSSSWHMDPSKSIVEWLWDFDKSDGVNWGSPDAVGDIAKNVSFTLPPGVVSDTFVVSLRVADNSDSVMTNIAEHTIIVNFDNHPPVADAGGPYAGGICDTIMLNGAGSYDPDEGSGDRIVSYSWDLDGDAVFGDCTDSICHVSWCYLYSGYVGLIVTDTYGATSDTSQAYVTIWTSRMDVSVTANDITFSDLSPDPGDLITISALIHCDAASDPVANVLVRFYDGNPAVEVHQIGGDQVIPAMLPGGATSVSVGYVVPDSMPRHIYVKVDPEGDIEEYNETNNEAFKLLKRQVVPPVIRVSLDIKPQSCPNPLDVKNGPKPDESKLPVAVLGSRDLDVRTIDVSTILLAGVAPLRWNYEDVATPVREDTAQRCECTTAGPDRYLDLTLKFDKQAIITAIGPVKDGDEVLLVVVGDLLDGRPISGADCVLIRGERTTSSAGVGGGTVCAANYPNPFNAATTITYTLGAPSHVSLTVYNVLGQTVARVVDADQSPGQYSVTWDCRDASGSPVVSGMYLYRFEAGSYVVTRKMALLK